MAGILGCLLLESLPSPYWVLLAAFVLFLRRLDARWRAGLLLFPLGFLLAWIAAAERLLDRLDGVQRLDADISGVVVGLPEPRQTGVRFQFAPSDEERLPKLIRLHWRSPPEDLRPGDVLSITARLRSPSGFRNSHGFDYERWLFVKGIGATGYVRAGDRVGHQKRWLDELRWQGVRWIAANQGGRDGGALVAALTMGYRGFINPDLRQQYQQAGTAHLIAISGLHVALISGLVYLLMRRVLRGQALGLNHQQWAALIAITVAGGYAALAGFALPTFRAWLMLSVGLGSLLWRRHSHWPHALMTALAVVLLLMPLSVLEAGFWLSFGAVAVLLYAAGGRSDTQGWRALLTTQSVVFLGLIPLLGFWFGAVPLWSPVINLLAIPLVGTVAVPIALLGVVSAPIADGFASGALALASAILESYSTIQASLLSWQTMQWSLPERPWLSYVLAAIAVFLLLSPIAMSLRLVGAVLLFPLLFGISGDRPVLSVVVFDVGQGQAVLVRTRHHALVYDMGPRYRSGFDTGASVVLPNIRAEGIDDVDLLLGSHDDLDHVGGLSALRRAFPQALVMGPSTLSGRSPDRFCRRGRRWHWDGVDFTVLHPPIADQGSDNNRSCVLRISVNGTSLLLPGDIEASVERRLLEEYGDALASTVLLAPHHGSRSSSSAAFLDAVSPEQVWVSAGWGNRWNMPHREVLARYEDRRIPVLNTGVHGAIRWSLSANGEVRQSSQRDSHKRLWAATR